MPCPSDILNAPNTHGFVKPRPVENELTPTNQFLGPEQHRDPPLISCSLPWCLQQSFLPVIYYNSSPRIRWSQCAQELFRGKPAVLVYPKHPQDRFYSIIGNFQIYLDDFGGLPSMELEKTTTHVQRVTHATIIPHEISWGEQRYHIHLEAALLVSKINGHPTRSWKLRCLP